MEGRVMSTPGEKFGGSTAESFAIRRMGAADVSAAFALLEESPEASIWSKEGLLETANRGEGWVAELATGAEQGSEPDIANRIAGILIGRVAADEFEILNLAVGKLWRRRGVASRLVLAAVEEAQETGALQTYLEVRASNSAAIDLYAQLGFRVCGRRENYYRDPGEDAVLLVLHKIR
jgi:ribosomal-protein-alanine N-acetyltransferase